MLPLWWQSDADASDDDKDYDGAAIADHHWQATQRLGLSVVLGFDVGTGGDYTGLRSNTN